MWENERPPVIHVSQHQPWCYSHEQAGFGTGGGALRSIAWEGVAGESSFYPDAVRDNRPVYLDTHTGDIARLLHYPEAFSTYLHGAVPFMVAGAYLWFACLS